MSISWGTEKRYIVQERSHRGWGSNDWRNIDRFHEAGDAFEVIRDQLLLLAKGRRKFPGNLEAYNREYRVIDGRRNHVMIWPAPDYHLPPPPQSKSPDHMMDAMGYVTQGLQIHNLRMSHSPSTI